ncbi:uncharacterized protein METZ01_LOCUS51444 [marine metagenome]|uniref:DUF7201 domain-containing protein n=1 Tax=marine metagenome TaxID=408172 RepID=A0A381S3F8_9ZZZZ|tara:strand:+ start:207 stop:638 length:432 start_codon:yes stop_codon:yes gene_type:complete
MDENNGIKTKVDIAKLKKDVEEFDRIHNRLDIAIDKLTDVSSSIKSMLAVHSEKINRQEQIDEVIFEKLKERAGEIDKVKSDLSQELEQVEKRLLIEIKNIRIDIGARVGMLEKYRWIILGAAIVIGWIVSGNFSEIVRLVSQ